MNYINGCKMKDIPIVTEDIAASFQKAVTDVLIAHAMRAAERVLNEEARDCGRCGLKQCPPGGECAACEKNGIAFYHPSPILCTDNAAMIGAAAYYEYCAGTRHGWDLNAVPNLKLGER
ncbi:MAG: hypothetical protein V8R80_07715 [Eubacterium sp.]